MKLTYIIALALSSCGIPLTVTSNGDGTITIQPPTTPIIVAKGSDGKVTVQEIKPPKVQPEK